MSNVKNLQPKKSALPILTIILIVASVLFGLMSNFGVKRELVDLLQISDYLSGAMFIDVKQGEVWRLITPIFVHFGPEHLFYNMLWLYFLGSRVELAYSSVRLLLMVLAFGLAGNLLQYYLVHANFGGMSAVVVGLMTYTWAHSQWMARPRVHIDTVLIIVMIVGELIMMQMNSNIAHWAHFGGAVAGVIWAAVESGKIKKLWLTK